MIARRTTRAAGKGPVQTSPERIATQSASTTAPAVRYFGTYLLGPREAVDRLEELAALLGGDLGVARLQRAGGGGGAVRASSAPATQWFTCSSRILKATVSRAVVAAAICVRMSMQYRSSSTIRS